MKTIKIKIAEVSIESRGNVTLKITNLDDKTEEIKLDKVPFAFSGNMVHEDLSKEDKEIVYQQAISIAKKYLDEHNIKTEAQIEKEAEEFINDIKSGRRPPDFIGYMAD